MAKNNANLTKILGKHLKHLSKDGLGSFIAAFCDLEPPQGISQMQIKHLEGKTPVEIGQIIKSFYTVRHARGKVIQALKNINENQIRVDLQKELRTDGVKKNGTKAQIKVANAPGTSGGPANTASQQMNVAASPQPGGDIKPKRGRKPKAAPGTSGGPANTAGQQMNVAASPQPGGDIKPKRGRKPRAAPGTSGGPANTAGQQMNVGTSPETGGHIRPKRGRKPQTDEEEHFVTKNRTNLIKAIANIEPVLDDLLDKTLVTQEEYDKIRKKHPNQERMRELYDSVKSWGKKGKDTFLKILEKHNSNAIKNLLEKSKRKKLG